MSVGTLSSEKAVNPAIVDRKGNSIEWEDQDRQASFAI